MICKNDLIEIMSTLINKEIDTEVILNAVSSYCNKSKEFFDSLLTFRVVQTTTSDGSICKGMINIGSEFIWVKLDSSSEGTIQKYILTGV